jgi:hypothetical protein
MLTGVAPRKRVAVSSTWNSGVFRSISTTRSPGFTPRARNPAAARATRSRYSAKVISCQSSPSFQRSATASPRAATVSRKARGMVWPAMRSRMALMAVLLSWSGRRYDGTGRPWGADVATVWEATGPNPDAHLKWP